jgi:cytochrome oxidase Cu insertion factor (SCO1/SenC/PrrC family)
MGHPLQTYDPTITSAFRNSLLHQLLIVLVVAALLMIAWNVIRTIRLRRAAAGTASTSSAGIAMAEPLARAVLRVSFGAIWILDGLLQAQQAMPLGLPGGVLTPAASSSPRWVQDLVNSGATIWSNHPITAATASVWIQVGVGLFLLVAPRGYWSRTAGAVSAGWGLTVWVFGEAFGGIFGHGSSWMFGSPGAVLFYVVAGGLVALPDRAWATPRTGRGILRAMGIFFIGMAVLQAWPGRGTWSGQATPTATPGVVTSMVQQMSQVSQPSVVASWVRWFGQVDAAHGWGVNLFVVLALVGIGACFVSGDARAARFGVIAGILLCVADWVLVQDMGFFGGVGTDPNSMIPMAIVFTSGYLGMVRLPRSSEALEPSAAADTRQVRHGAPDPFAPSDLWRLLAAVGALAMVLIGAAPMALAATNPHADPILAEAVNGTPNVVNFPAYKFTLTDQSNRTVSLDSLRGRTVVLTFLDPVCTTDCPIIAQELRAADQQLGSAAAGVDLVAVVNNPLFLTSAATNAFDRQEGLAGLRNWLFLTGPLHALQQVWNDYGVLTSLLPAGAMVSHNDLVYVIDPKGNVRAVLDSDPGSGSAIRSSFTSLLTAQVLSASHT